MIADAALRVTGAAKPTTADAVASIAVIGELADRATYGHAQAALDAIAKAPALDLETRNEAALALRAITVDEGKPAGIEADRRLGVITDLALLGPFRDTGGGLASKEGPEAPGGSFADMRAHYAWGTIDVAWRAVPRSYATASGVPLDVFVHPRKESCSIVATKVTLPAAMPIVVRLASTGQARLMLDATLLGRSDDVHASAQLDRLAARVEATAGAHVVWAKICTGALEDDGRVRLRITDDKGAALAPYTASADLSGEAPPQAKAAKRGAPATPAMQAQAVTTPLARALALSANADATAQLEAAIARTLGGADDLKSPRAPGLLDAVTRAKDLDADRLAMAGWIAPSGANRSGWLNLARTRAEAMHDDKAAAFATRRLVAEHLSARMADWALATHRAARLDAAKDDEAMLLGALIAEALGTDALRAQAKLRLGAAFAAAKERVPTSLVLEPA
jgi:hypothetical protein